MPFPTLTTTLMTMACLCGLLGDSQVQAAEKRPNFVFILTDDQSPETLRAYGNTVCETPNIDRLAAEGMVFDDAHHGVYCGGTKPGMRAVKTGDWKLIKYDVLDGQVRKTQLFNLKENPKELLAEHHTAKLKTLLHNEPTENQINLADLPEYEAKRKEMEALLKREMQRLDDPYTMED